jgi:peroxiredoxin Q/BCP
MPEPDENPLPAGAAAPDFELNATGGRRVRLSKLLRDGPVALFFYPGNNTPG